jgi:hypothetical protein
MEFKNSHPYPTKSRKDFNDHVQAKSKTTSGLSKQRMIHDVAAENGKAISSFQQAEAKETNPQKSTCEFEYDKLDYSVSKQSMFHDEFKPSKKDEFLVIGNEVEYKYRGKMTRGKITNCRPGGTYDLLLDNGKKQICVSKSSLELVKIGSKMDLNLTNETSRSNITGGDQKELNESKIFRRRCDEQLQQDMYIGSNVNDAKKVIKKHHEDTVLPRSTNIIQDMENEVLQFEVDRSVGNAHGPKAEIFSAQDTFDETVNGSDSNSTIDIQVGAMFTNPRSGGK